MFKRVVTFEARWRTSSSMKLQNSIETASTVSAIQYSPHLLFSIRGVWKRRQKSVFNIRVLCILAAFSDVLVWTINEHEKKKKNTTRYRMKTKRKSCSLDENALVWTRKSLENVSLKEKLLSFVFLVWSGLYTGDKSRGYRQTVSY